MHIFQEHAASKAALWLIDTPALTEESNSHSTWHWVQQYMRLIPAILVEELSQFQRWLSQLSKWILICDWFSKLNHWHRAEIRIGPGKVAAGHVLYNDEAVHLSACLAILYFDMVHFVHLVDLFRLLLSLSQCGHRFSSGDARCGEAKAWKKQMPEEFEIVPWIWFVDYRRNSRNA